MIGINYFKGVIESDRSIFSTGGTSWRMPAKEVRMMLEFFPMLTEDEIKTNNTKFNIEAILTEVVRVFAEKYKFGKENFIIDDNCRDTIVSYIYSDGCNPSLIHIDEIFQSTLMSFLIVSFKWALEMGDAHVYSECFKHILYLMNETCIFSEMQEEISNRKTLELLNGDLSILIIAEEFYWTIVAFTVSHEIAHRFLKDKGIKYSKYHPEKEEYDADIIAYRVVLEIITISRNESSGIHLEEYTYLAPMIFMCFFDLYYYTDRILYGSTFDFITHPNPIRRRDRLFNVCNDAQYLFDTEKGNEWYNVFLEAYTEYRKALLLKKQNRKLEAIIQTKRREVLRMQEELYFMNGVK